VSQKVDSLSETLHSLPIYKNKNLFYSLAKQRSNSKRQFQTRLVLSGLVRVSQLLRSNIKTLRTDTIHKNKYLIHTLAKQRSNS